MYAKYPSPAWYLAGAQYVEALPLCNTKLIVLERAVLHPAFMDSFLPSFIKQCLFNVRQDL